MTCGLRKEVIMRKQTRHRFVATNYNHYKCLLPFLLYNFYFMRFAQRRKGKLAKTKIFLSLTSGVCFFALIFENYHTIPLNDVPDIYKNQPGKPTTSVVG